MKALSDIASQYTRRARYKPALIIVLPLGLAVLSWSPDGLKSLTALWSVFVWAGGTALMAQIARDRGRRKEQELFQTWGGKPTTQLLRYSGCENPVLVAKRHADLQKALPDIKLPTDADEAAKPREADHIYDTCVRWLLEHTRDQKKYSLLFEENCNYGFRRNLWGMKPIGILMCVISLLISSCALIVNLRAGATSSVNLASVVCISGLLLFWLTWCTSGWVKLTADAYAERLLAAVNTIERVESKKPGKTIGAPKQTKSLEDTGAEKLPHLRTPAKRRKGKVEGSVE